VWLALKLRGLVLPAAAKELRGCDNTGESIVFRRSLYDCRQTCCGGFLLLFSKISFSLVMKFFLQISGIPYKLEKLVVGCGAPGGSDPPPLFFISN
jgi:hypothetical protein